MLRHVGDYDFGGHTALRVIEAKGEDAGGARAGYQFNFTVRSRVALKDGVEYLFDFYTVVVLPDVSVDEKQGSADLLAKVRGFSRPHAQEPQTSEKRGLRYSLELRQKKFRRDGQPDAMLLTIPWDSVGNDADSG